ncbi:mucin-17 isoform X2 [Drosophila innubila]|uniref:mucin-17 isoform X2 n=1 Tax=Drosophila innubila TaxID=198719 RepID=UPI00148E68D6|nr:mucin-17 isoform X2 [Drosophila innubila]
MSSMKGGFSTLNRWFGRKKDKSGVGSAASNGKLSKSTTQLHHLSTDTNMHINEASQLDYNRITPLPVATSNAPFEQTFRITVLLPKDQLYVARLGARVPLSKLLSLVCDNKQLDADKYEFRNPVDASQVYSCESTIGAVGLSEIRLCHKSESYDSFNADSMLKFQRTVAARDSLSSSSDFSSSRHSQSKLTAKTPSPYSSSNSLNSMDSTGMNYTRTPVVPPKALAPPPRKKRVAPRPPSQLMIPEQSVAQFTTERDRDRNRERERERERSTEPAYAVIVKRPQLCMSTPNLASTPELETELVNELDCNGNSAKTLDGGHYATLEIKTNGGLPEPTPRKRLIQLKKKTAPAPPPTDAMSAMSADSISLASTTASITEMAPQPAPRITTPNPAPVTPSAPTPTPSPTPNPSTNPEEQLPPPLPMSAAPQLSTNQNVSKVLLNRTPTPEPRSLSSANEEEEEEMEEGEGEGEEDNNDAASKQADSGIGEPVVTPLNSTSPSPEPEPQPEREKASGLQLKSQLESSSEDEEAIKVYNFKTSCETSLKTAQEQQLTKVTTLAELKVLTKSVGEGEEEGGATEDEATSEQPTPNSASELTSLSSWNYAVPISPPPDFSDTRSKDRGNNVASSPLDEIVDELSSIINQQRLDTLIRQAPEQSQIEAAKPNRLANFSIASISNGCTTRSGNSSSSSSSTATTPTTPKTIMRADSFQAVGQSGLGLRLRSSSQLSLNKLEIGNASGGLHPRRSSSELSIAESPSLQSLELIKTILSNSRKNSLADSPDSPQSGQLQVQLETFVKPKKSPSTSTRSLSNGAASPVSITPTSAVAPASSFVPAPASAPAPSFASPSLSAPVASVRASPVEDILAEQPAQSVSSASTATLSSITLLSPSPASPASFVEAESQVAISPVTSPALSPSPITSSAASSPASASAPSLSPAPASTSTPAPAPAPAPVPAAKPLPPTYRYSGPPSINFATWSERPKSQVAIKNEGDYIYGGATTAAATAAPPAAPPKPVAAPAKLTIEVASPILRMGIPRKEYHVPITVKPLRDANEELEREQQKQREMQANPAQKPELPSREPLRKTVMESQREILREPQRDLVKPSTLPRPAKSNRFTLPAQAHSTITSPTSSTTTTTTMLNATSTNSLPRPLSTLERKSLQAEPVAAPFGQNTLRRTGFKERMLAKEQEEKEQALRVRVSVNGMATPMPTPTPTPTVTAAATTTPTAAAVESKATIIRSSKLELKLQQQQPEVATPVAAPVATPMLQVKLRPTSQMPVATSSPPPPPPAAPPAPAKAKPMRNVGVAAPDPRTQLLDAIRNFKREELNRA